MTTFEVAQAQGGKRTIVRADKFVQVDDMLQFYAGSECTALFHMDGGFSVMGLTGGDGKCQTVGCHPNADDARPLKFMQKVRLAQHPIDGPVYTVDGCEVHNDLTFYWMQEIPGMFLRGSLVAIHL